jgi:hypothetical protein
MEFFLAKSIDFVIARARTNRSDSALKTQPLHVGVLGKGLLRSSI